MHIEDSDKVYLSLVQRSNITNKNYNKIYLLYIHVCIDDESTFYFNLFN